MVSDYESLTSPIRGHTMIITSTGKGEEKEVYLIGGLSTATHISGQYSIMKLLPDPDHENKPVFKPFASLRHGRAYHIALPISYQLAKDSCLDHYEWRKIDEVSDRH